MTERVSLVAEGSCCHGSDGRTSVTIVASGRTVRVCPACDVHEQIAAATNIPSELQRLEQGRNGTLLLYTNLAGGFGADDNKAYIAPIVFTCLLVAAAVVGVTLVILWELKDLRFSTIWWIGAGFCMGAACLLLIVIPCWIFACCCSS